MNTERESHPTETYATVKLGIDVHARWYYVARQLDGATPQPVQKMTFQELLRSGKWWPGGIWRRILAEAPAWVGKRLKAFIRLIEPMEAEEKAMTAAIAKSGAEAKIPRGVGPLTFEVLRRELGD